jgi:hypothetical protein
MNVNFIITVNNRENYWPYLKEIFNSYKIIKPNIALCYNGNDKNFTADFKCINKGHIEGEIDLIIGGYNLLKNNKINKWVKIGVDSWLLNEEKILSIFNEMDKQNSIYGGSYWNGYDRLSTDIFFASTENINFLEELNYLYGPPGIEFKMLQLINKFGGFYIIPERQYVDGCSGSRFVVESLGWVIQHDLRLNLKFVELYKQKHFLKEYNEEYYQIVMKKINEFDWHNFIFVDQDIKKLDLQINEIMDL